MELETALLGKFWTVLTSDATLQAAMGGTVRLYPDWAVDDATWPFLVHKFDFRATEFFPILNGSYTIDLWSDTDTLAEILAMRDRIMTLLDEKTWDIQDGGIDQVTVFRIWLQGSTPVAEPMPGIHHRVILFNIRFYRTKETSNLL